MLMYRRSVSLVSLSAVLGVGLLTVATPRPVAAQLIGPSPYLAFDNSVAGAGTSISPFSGISFANYFNLETFEDGLLNTTGVSASIGAPIPPGSITDSVDADDGTIDGSGIAGNSFFTITGGTTFTFNGAALGGLPTHVGLVWTDGGGTITFQAFDADNNLIDTLIGTHADGSISGTTGEDRFYGIIAPGGIGSISMSNNGGGLEVDHLQYGLGAQAAGGAAPEPGTLALLALGSLPLAGAVLRRRRA